MSEHVAHRDNAGYVTAERGKRGGKREGDQEQEADAEHHGEREEPFANYLPEARAGF